MPEKSQNKTFFFVLLSVISFAGGFLGLAIIAIILSALGILSRWANQKQWSKLHALSS